MLDGPLRVTELCKSFRTGGGFLSGGSSATVEAVADVSFELGRGESLGIVGESGSGKTTIARMLVGLEEPSRGTIEFGGTPLAARPTVAERHRRARAIQIVFQDPYTSLDPRQRIQDALDEVQREQFSRTAAERAARSRALLDSVGLGEREGRAVPRRLSGGQRQRAAIARALAAEPRLLILDEAVSALDVSIQAQILNLLGRLRREFDLTYILISHDLAVVRQLSDRVLVMYEGRVVESGPVEAILTEPRHPYTQRLLASVARPRMELEGRAAHLLEATAVGCRFRPRCEFAFDRCAQEPGLLDGGPTHQVRCWLIAEVPADGSPQSRNGVLAEESERGRVTTE